MNKYPIVEITWLDSVGVTGDWEFWEDASELKPHKIKTAGYLIKDNKDYKEVALAVSKGQLVGRMSIPTCSIVKMKKRI